jgi:hypothetical protein
MNSNLLKPIGIISIILFLVFCVIPIPYKDHASYICSTCGTRKIESSYIFTPQKTKIVTSPFYLWIKKYIIKKHVHDFKHLTTTRYTTIGPSRGCSRAPAIYTIHGSQDIIMDSHSNEQLSELYHNIQNKTKDEQYEIFQQSMDIGLDKLDDLDAE